MPRFLIDANLPYRFALWQGDLYVHDAALWRYAKDSDLVIEFVYQCACQTECTV